MSFLLPPLLASVEAAAKLATWQAKFPTPNTEVGCRRLSEIYLFALLSFFAAFTKTSSAAARSAAASKYAGEKRVDEKKRKKLEKRNIEKVKNFIKRDSAFEQGRQRLTPDIKNIYFCIFEIRYISGH